jgi:hypothetical protein
LRVTVGVIAAFPGLAIGLQAVTEFAQQAGYRIVANPVTQALQGPSQVAQALARPQQWRLWITARGWLYQFAQIIEQRGIAGSEFLPPTASSTNPTRRNVRSCAPQVGQTTPDRAACHPGDARQHRNDAPSCRPRFGRRKPTPTPLVQNRIKRCVA